jgi:hypothetical protein
MAVEILYAIFQIVPDGTLSHQGSVSNKQGRHTIECYLISVDEIPEHFLIGGIEIDLERVDLYSRIFYGHLIDKWLYSGAMRTALSIEIIDTDIPGSGDCSIGQSPIQTGNRGNTFFCCSASAKSHQHKPHQENNNPPVHSFIFSNLDYLKSDNLSGPFRAGRNR